MRVCLGVALAAISLTGCQMKPDIGGQRDIGFYRPERSGEVTAEQAGRSEAQDMTTEASIRQRAAADQLASGKQSDMGGRGSGG